MSGKLQHYIQRIKDGRISEIYGEIKWIYQYTRKHLLSVIIYTALGLSGTVVSLLSSLVSRDLVDIITGHRTSELLTTFCIMIGVTLGSTLIGQISGYISTKINLKVENHIKANVFNEIMNTEWESLSRYHSGDLLVRWNSDASVVSNSVLNLIPNCIVYFFHFISSLAMVLYYDASFAVFALLSIPVSMIVSREAMNRMRKENMSNIVIGSRMSSFNQEAFSNVQTIKAFDMLSTHLKRLKILQAEYAGVRLKYQKAMIFNSIILTVVSLLVSYSAQGWGIYKVWSGSITYGTMTMFITLSTSLSGSVNNLINLIPSTISLTNASKRLREIMDMPKEDYSQKNEVKSFYEAHKEEGVGLCVRDIAYTYANGTEVFEHASIDAHPHEIVAFVGPSGEGKTTMMRFLLSLIRTQEGKGYLCAGKAVPESDTDVMPLTAAVRQLCAYVPQGNTMFYGTIAENMRNVKEDATDEDIIEALKIACAWDFVEKLPDGINSEIKERGGGFSEGQAQRLSIARAVLRQSPILLLDEATSALDIALEKNVLRNIMQTEYPRTSIVTTHRPSVLRMCDRVYSIRNQQCVVLNQEEIDNLINA